MTQLSIAPEYWRAIWMTALGSIILSVDSLLFRLLEADLWTAAFWRLLLMGIAVTLYIYIRRRRMIVTDLSLIGWTMLPAVLCMSASNLGFLYGLTHTTVADTLAIIATAPVFSAIFAMALGERPPLRTWIAAAAVAVGIALIFGAGFSGGGWRGQLGAATAAICIAIFFTLCRLKRGVEMTPALGLSSFASAGLAAILATTLAPPAGDWPVLLLLGWLVLPAALITLGPRHLPAAEVGLLMLLETALGPLWVWLALGEEPSAETLAGGALILGALIAHSLAALRRRR